MMNRELLLIEDEPALCRALSSFFGQRGFRVSTAMTGQGGIEQIRRTPADVVLLDLKLPDSSGLEILSELKAQYPNLRVVVISGLSDAPTIQEAMQRGASDYLAKPFDFDRCFYAAMGLEPVELSTAQPESEALARVPVLVAQQYRVLPLRWKNDALELAMADPLDVRRLDELKTILKCDVRPLAMAGQDAELLDSAIHRWYGVGADVSEPREQPPHPAPRSRSSTAASRQGSDDTAGIVRLVNDLVQHAHANRATDVHFGNGPQGPWIRERIDGVLYDVPVAAQFGQLYLHVISRLKVMASLDISEHRLPQDGRIWFALGSTRLDLRLSLLPTVHGEHLAIRLLEPTQTFQLDQLGLSDEQLRGVAALLARPTGLLLVTGPTGSGKSTSLYACLSRLNTGRVNIVTIEDPVEHEMSGVTQIQVQPKINLTFANGLRSMLRHDPDVIMVGEIRDQETANLAVRAALTGHLVLSTLHTNDASSGITRLMDLGIEPFLLCSTLSGIVSQRLVRRLCPACREPVQADRASVSSLGIALSGPSDTVPVWRARGCTACRSTGFHGRTGVFELLTVDHRVRSLLIKRTPSVQIRQSAISNGMCSLMQSGWRGVETGVTSLEEVTRVLPQELR